MLEFLYSTGCRVGEVQKQDIEDINLEDCSAIVNGKGAKQREIYFTTECKIWIKRYLESRDDSCTALFVTETQPARRMSIPMIRHSLKKLASRTNVAVNVYPHRFRHAYDSNINAARKQYRRSNREKRIDSPFILVPHLK